MKNKIIGYLEEVKDLIKKIFFNSLSSFFIITVFLISYCYLTPLENFNTIIVGVSKVLSIIIIVLYLFRLRSSDFVKCIVIYSAFLFLSTLIGDKSSLDKLYETYYRIIAIVFYIDWGLNIDKKRLITSLFYSLFVIITMNFITILVYPKGMYKTLLYYQNWFLKYKNIHIMTYMPALLVAYIRCKYMNKVDIITILLFGMITFSVYYCASSTSMVAYTLFLIYILMYNKINKLKWMNVRNYFILFIAIFVFIVILRWQELFSWLIVDILGKNLTFTHRTDIWDKIIYFIQKNPILGYGMEMTSYLSKKLGDPRFTHAHNTILDILYKGGILSFIPYITMIILTTKELFKNRTKEIAKFGSCILLCLFIMMNFEARQEVIGTYLILIICYYIGEIIGDINNKGCNKKELSNS